MVKVFVFVFLTAIFSCAEPHKVIRPCALTNYFCIRENLAANSNCKPSNIKGLVPREYTVPKFRYEAPYFNASYVDNNLSVRNQDRCFVSEFAFNVDTDKVILALDCPDLELESDRELIQHWSLKEDQYFYYHVISKYPLVRFTINLPSTTHMDLCKAGVFSDVAKLPEFKISPNDKPTLNFLSRDSSAVPIFEREMFFYRGFPLARTFIDSVLCDFSCPLTIL